MKPEIKKRLKRTAFLALLAFVIGASVGMMQSRTENASVVQKASSIAPMAGVQIGGPYELVDHNSQTVTQEKFAGDYKLIFFGFTFCPMICPTELQKISKTLDKLGKDGENIQPLFITVDPERDTVEVMQEYVALFDKNLVGLTGSRAQIDEVLKNYRVFAQKVENPNMPDYMMDHSAYIYLMSPNDQLITMYRTEDSADYIAQDIKSRLLSG